MVSVAYYATHSLGAQCLRHLSDHPDINIQCIVTYGDDHDGWWDTTVGNVARELGYEPRTLEAEHDVLNVDVDYLLSVYYPNILDGKLLEAPNVGAFNLHQAELPRYRGSNPFAHAIINARTDDHWQYGTTFHEMVEAVDSGPIVDREFVMIKEDDTARSLYERTRKASLRLFDRILPLLVSKTVHEHTTPQSEFSGQRYHHRKDSLNDLFNISKERFCASDRETELAVWDQIRALEFPPMEPAFTELNGERVYLTTRCSDR